MSRFNKLFSDDPPGEPKWMREFARGGDPMVHRQDESWPAAGVAAYNAGRGKNIQASLRTQSASAGARSIRPGLGRRGGTSTARRGSPKSGKEGGGCACGGGGKCKSVSAGTPSPASTALTSAQMASSGSSGQRSGSPTLAELVAQVRTALVGSGSRMSTRQTEGLVRRAKALEAAYAASPQAESPLAWAKRGVQ